MEAMILDMNKVPLHKAADWISNPPKLTTLTEWPSGTFIENLTPLQDGSFIVSLLNEARLERVLQDGKRQPMRQFQAPPTGLAILGGGLYVNVGEPGHNGHAIWKIDQSTGEGDIAIDMPDARFLNGLTPFDAHSLLVPDSLQGRLYHIDLRTKKVHIWFEDERLMQAPSVPELPGVNGVKRYKNSVTVTSTGKALVLRIAIKPDGSAGAVSLVSDQLRGDDIAFDADGNLYITTHLGNSLDRLSPDGTRVKLAGVEQGMAGSTACTFGVKGGLYVTTTGGIVNPQPGGIQPARLLRVDVDASPYPIEPKESFQ